jgi:hypothetical protein
VHVDTYTDDPSMIGKYCNIGGEELLENAKITLEKLLKLTDTLKADSFATIQ